MRSSKITLLKLIPSGLSLLLALGSFTVFAACGVKEDGSWMRCHSAQTTVTLCAVLLSVFLVLPAFIREKALKIVLNGIGIVGSAAIFLIPGKLMPMCMIHAAGNGYSGGKARRGHSGVSVRRHEQNLQQNVADAGLSGGSLEGSLHAVAHG